MEPIECLKRVFPSAIVAHGKLVLETPPKGIRLLYRVNGGEKKRAELGEKFTVEKGQRLEVYERHFQIEILPVAVEGKTRFTAIVTEDYRSFGKDLAVFATAFDLDASTIVNMTEADGRKSLQAARDEKSKGK